jgi:hypothetical protein
MSDCCLPNLGCLAIPVLSTNVAGPTGAAGAAATIDVGTVTTVNPGDPATVTNSGTTSAAIFDFEIPEGVAGTPGAAGVDGVSRLYSNFVSSSAAAPLGTFYTVDTYQVPANMLLNDGDALVINLRTSRASSTGSCKRKVSWNGVSITAPIISEIEMYTASGIYQYNTKIEIVKTGSTTASCNIVSDYDINTNNPSGVQTFTYQKNISSVNFGIINTITIGLTQALANQAVFKSLTIDKITAL